MSTRALRAMILLVFLALAACGGGGTTPPPDDGGTTPPPDDSTGKNRAPTADTTGSETLGYEFQTIRLDAGQSADPDGDALGYKWKQLEGPSVTIHDSTKASAYFIPDETAERDDYVFQVSVTDPQGMIDSAIVDVTIKGNSYVLYSGNFSTSDGPNGDSVHVSAINGTWRRALPGMPVLSADPWLLVSPDGNHAVVAANLDISDGHGRIWVFKIDAQLSLIQSFDVASDQNGNGIPDGDILRASFNASGDKIAYGFMQCLGALIKCVENIAILKVDGHANPPQSVTNFFWEDADNDSFPDLRSDSWQWSPGGERIAYSILVDELAGEFGGKLDVYRVYVADFVESILVDTYEILDFDHNVLNNNSMYISSGYLWLTADSCIDSDALVVCIVRATLHFLLMATRSHF